MVLSNQAERDRSQLIAVLNDAFRTTFVGGSVVVTDGLYGLGPDIVKAALVVVRDFSAFAPDNDPYKEHDFGSVRVAGRQLFWKIDYYAANMISGSEDPTDVNLTRRVLTVMLAEEY